MRKTSYPLKRSCPTGTERVAAYHTHGVDSGGEYVDEFFSSTDKDIVKDPLNHLDAFYLATPDGTFKALNNKAETIISMDRGSGLSSVCIPYQN